MMTRTEFENLLLLHGSDINGWPDDKSEQARNLLEKSQFAQETLLSFREFDDHINDAVKVQTQGAALTGRVLTHVAERSGGRNPGASSLGPGFITAIGSTLAVTMLGLGFFVGSLDMAWFDGATTSELSLLLFGETEYLMETL